MGYAFSRVVRPYVFWAVSGSCLPWYAPVSGSRMRWYALFYDGQLLCPDVLCSVSGSRLRWYALFCDGQLLCPDVLCSVSGSRLPWYCQKNCGVMRCLTPRRLTPRCLLCGSALRWYALFSSLRG